MNSELIHTQTNARVRFAPSPTGIPHVGNIRTALFDYFFAKNKKGTFILRIEDTDQARKIEGATEAIKESLSWLGADWDEFVVQSEHLDDYRKFAEELVKKGIAREENGAIRFEVQRENGQKIVWRDLIGNKEISFEADDIEDFIILKADGYPTYHLANVIDDHLMGITHVIRGEDWIPSTPKHLLLYQAFGWNPPLFAHVPNVLGTDGKKLSKRKGAKSVLDYKNEGYLPEALLNYLMLLGWSPKDDRELLTKEEISKEFSLENVNSAPSIFDERKLQWMNGEYIRQMPLAELVIRLKEYDKTITMSLTYDEFVRFVQSSQTRIKTLAEFRRNVEPFLNPTTNPSPLLISYGKALEEVGVWSAANISTATITFMQTENKRYPDIYQAIIGQKQGLPLADVFEALGKEETLKRLK